MSKAAPEVPMVPGPEKEEEDGLTHLAEVVGRTARARAVFGEPVERDGVAVIPVAKARWGFGGGSGESPSGEGGGGGGGGVMLKPVGYIEVRDGKARFRPIMSSGAAALAMTAALLIVGRTLRKVLS